MIEAWEQKYHISIRKIFSDPIFLTVLAIKIVAGTLFASDYFTKGFAPFVNYFVTSGFHNPYDYFASLGQTAAFPYPPIMLGILAFFRTLAIPFLGHASWTTVNFGTLFILHLPILLADALIYFVLCQWLPTREKKVLWYYWASPVLFFINYFHGQLDVIPMAILFVSLVFLFRRQLVPAFILLGISIATKTNLIVALPFYAIYLRVNKYPLRDILFESLVAVATALIFILPFINSAGFVKTVFGTDEALKVFLVTLPYQHQSLQLLLAPLAVAILFFNFYVYKKLNRDAFILILGLLFTVFVIFVPPMPGWFYWSIPFFVYYFAKYRETPHLSFWFLNAAYVSYFVLASDSHVISSFHLISPSLTDASTPFILLQSHGLNMNLTINLIFTSLVASIIMNAVWIFRTGVRSNLEYASTEKPLTIGIGGDSGAGKTMLAELVRKVFGHKQATMVEGDDAHRWERGDEHWKQQTHLDPRSNRLHSELDHAGSLKKGEAISRRIYDHDTGKFTEPSQIEPSRVLIYLGLHPFYLSKMRRMLDIKIFLDPDEKLRRHWKVVRDSQKRGKTKAEVLKQLDSREKDSQKYIRPQRNFADLVITLFPVSTLSAKKEPNLGVRITCDNSLAVDPLMEILAEHRGLHVEHWYEDDLEKQGIEFTGKVSAESIKVAAHRLIPNLEELIGQLPDWQANCDGICQLMIAYYYSEHLKVGQ